MDTHILGFESEPFGDLVLCQSRGVAYQRDMTHRVTYDESYFNKCLSYEDKDIAVKINAGRIALVNDWLSYTETKSPVLDIGIGSGEFIKKRPDTFGFDVNPVAVDWLKDRGCFSSDIESFLAFTFWDVLEHIENPGEYFDRMQHGSLVFVSIPVFMDLKRVRASRHYRPGEHLYYFTPSGFADWMGLHGFALKEIQTFEMEAGRQDIWSYAFRKNGKTGAGRKAEEALAVGG